MFGRTFRPGLLQSILFLGAFALLIWLGLWQLDRGEEKLQIQRNYAQRSALPPLRLAGGDSDGGQLQFRRAVVSGRYDREYEIFLDNKVHDGRPGYHVLTPMHVDDRDAVILVNRGWIAGTGDRQTLPAVSAPSGRITVAGLLRLPAEDYFSLVDESDSAFSTLWQNLDMQRFRRTTGLKVYPVVLQLDPEDASAGGLLRVWPAYRDDWVARHKGYALQWFGLAAVLMVVFVALNLKPHESSKDHFAGN